MHIFIALVALLALPASLAAQAIEVSQASYKISDGYASWDYTVTVKAVATPTKISIWFAVPATVAYQVTDGSAMKVSATPQDVGAFRGISFDVPKDDSTFHIIWSGPETLVRNETEISVKWRLDGQDTPQDATRMGPVVLYDPSDFRLVFGAGISVRTDDWIDFRVDKELKRLFTENDSRMRASGILGAMFKLKDIHRKGAIYPWDLMVSLEFAAGSQKNLDGFLFGTTIGVGKYISLGGGYALRRGLELSRGFEDSSKQLVAAALQDEKYKQQFERFSGIATDPEAFDGFPLVDPRTNTSVFPGDNPITSSYNGSFFLGVFIPVDILKAMRPGGQ